jgi:hypothetical protein
MRSIAIALTVGTAFFVMDQLGTVLAGHAAALTWVKICLTYLTPLCVSNFGILSATYRSER